jgi:diaminopimelate decarboxylase
MLWPETAERDTDGRLSIGGVGLPELAARFGTPLYVYCEATLRIRAHRFRDAFGAAYPDSRVVYASKALMSLAILRLLRDEGLGLDVVSGGELHAALAAGVPAGEITFHGNNKGESELREALAAGIGHVAVDNLLEVDLLSRLAQEIGTSVPLLLRLNPGVDVHTHAKIRTGVTDSKFGLPIATGDAAEAVARVLAVPELDLVGYHCHLGSQLFDAGTYAEAIRVILSFAAAMRDQHGAVPRVLSPGGGFGIAYVEGQEEASVEAWAAATADAVRAGCREHDLPMPQLVVEPGRAIVGPAGVALYRVGAIKPIPGVRTYVSVDGGMADNIRPALYGARYAVSLANRVGGEPAIPVTIAGKYCESGDILVEDVALPALEPGDLLALPAAGAYCLAMASNYNLATRPAAVLVRNGSARLVRRRETYDDLLALEILPDGDRPQA